MRTQGDADLAREHIEAIRRTFKEMQKKEARDLQELQSRTLVQFQQALAGLPGVEYGQEASVARQMMQQYVTFKSIYPSLYLAGQLVDAVKQLQGVVAGELISWEESNLQVNKDTCCALTVCSICCLWLRQPVVALDLLPEGMAQDPAT